MFKARLHIIFKMFFLIIVTPNIWAGEYIQYLSPRPGANYVSTKTTLAFRFHEKWKKNLNKSVLTLHVTGDESGSHEGEVLLTDDGRTFIFKSNRKFFVNEIIRVQIIADLPGFDNPMTYQFTTSSTDNYDGELFEVEGPQNEGINNFQIEPHQTMAVINGVSVPSDFPRIDVEILEESASGRLFLNNMDGVPYIIILENDGTPYFYKRMEGRSWDFKVQPTGTITHRIDGNLNCFIELDSTFTAIDTLS